MRSPQPRRKACKQSSLRSPKPALATHSIASRSMWILIAPSRHARLHHTVMTEPVAMSTVIERAQGTPS